MKRLQIRHHEDIFDSRASAMQYFADIVDPDKVLSTQFGSTLYSEPVVAKYLDESGGTQVVLAIGTEDGQSPFHIIDSADILERIERNSDGLQTLDEKIDNETARAKEEEAKLQEQITNNISKIESVSPSAANVLEEYALRNALGEQLGETVKVYRDSKFIGAAFGFKGAKGVSVSPDGDITLEYDEEQMDETVETIYFVYTDEYGEYALFPVNLEQVILESEIGNGLQVEDHVLSVKVAEGEQYIRVNEDGISSNGINEAISSEIEKLSEELTAKIDGEIARSTEADVYISGVVSSFSATVVSEVERIDSDIASETERAKGAEDFLSGALQSEITRATGREDELESMIDANKVYSKDIKVEPSESGTSLTIITDEVTITKYAKAGTIYDEGVGVLGTLLKLKKLPVEEKEEFKLRYALQDAAGNTLGQTIDIPNEQSLVHVGMGTSGDEVGDNGEIIPGTGTSTLNFVYKLNNGTYTLVKIDISKYFDDVHFGQGLNTSGGVVSLVSGTGNEYLVINEDSIAVVGVNAAISAATQYSVAYTNKKTGEVSSAATEYYNKAINAVNTAYSASIAYADQKFSDSKAYTDTSVASVTGAIESLTNTLNESIANVNNALNAETQNRETADKDILSKISGEISARTDGDANLLAMINKEIADRTEGDSEERKYADEKIAALEERVKALEDICDNLIDFGTYRME